MPTKNYKIRQYGKRLKKIGQSRDAGYVAVIGKLDGTVLVGSGNLIYVTTIPEGQTRQVINRRVPNNPGDLVFVGKDGLSANKTEILYTFNLTGDTVDGVSTYNSIVPAHSHSYPGANTTWVYSGQVMALNCLPIAGTLTVQVYPGVIRKVGSEGWKYIAEQVVDVSGAVPGSGALWITLQANDDGSVDYVAGSSAASRDALDETNIPEATTGRALFAIILEAGFGELQRNSVRDDFFDLRFFGMQAFDHNSLLGIEGGGDYLGYLEAYHLARDEWEALVKGMIADGYHFHDAGAVLYSPLALSDWDYSADPGETAEALDQLASRLTDLEASPPGSWDGDLTDMDFTSGADIGEALADADRLVVYNSSGAVVARFELSRLLQYITPGSDTYLLFNDGGVPGADINLTYNKIASLLTVPNQKINGTLSLTLLAAPTLASNENDYSPTGMASATGLLLASTADYEITGIATGSYYRVIFIHNQGDYSLTLKNQDAASSAANRFDFGSDFVLGSKQSAWLIYQPSSRWKLLATSDGSPWDGDLTDLDVTSSTDIGEAIADTDQGIIYNASGTAWERFAWSRVKTYIQAASDLLYQPLSGWQTVAETWTYAGADDPVYQIYVSGDVTADPDYELGNKVWCQNNSTDFFGFIVKVGAYDGGNNRTPVDIYGGTSYDLANSAITAPYISKVKNPDGFNISPSLWTVSASDSTSPSQATPTQNVWYNLNTFSVDLPIGVWDVTWQAVLYVNVASGAVVDQYGTLSTANNSESDSDLTALTYKQAPTGANGALLTVSKNKLLVLAAKTTYYLNAKTGVSGMQQISFLGALSTTRISAVCAYL